MAQRRRLTEEMVQNIREMYATREFTMSDLSREFGVSVSVISNAINKGYCPKPKGMTEAKERTEIIENHIMQLSLMEEQ